jgi:hypothetical protein
MIAITSVFTTLKYYPSNSDLFRDRLLRYSRTLPRSAADRFVFEYRSIKKEDTAFAFVPVAEFIVDPDSGTVVEKALDGKVSVRATSEHSPVHEGVRPGSYAPPI